MNLMFTLVRVFIMTSLKNVKLDKSAYVIFFFAYVIILTPYFLRNGG